MKLLILLALSTFAINSYSHCGACGEGIAEDHKEKGEDHSHHSAETDKNRKKKDKKKKEKK